MYVDGYEKIKNSPSKANAVVMNVFRKRIHRHLHYAMEEMRKLGFLEKNYHLEKYITPLTAAVKKMDGDKISDIRKLLNNQKFPEKNLQEIVTSINAILNGTDNDSEKLAFIRSAIESGERISSENANFKTFIDELKEIAQSDKKDQATEINDVLKSAKDNNHYDELMQYFEQSRITTLLQHAAAGFDTFTVVANSALYDVSYYMTSWGKFSNATSEMSSTVSFS